MPLVNHQLPVAGYGWLDSFDNRRQRLYFPQGPFVNRGFGGFWCSHPKHQLAAPHDKPTLFRWRHSITIEQPNIVTLEGTTPFGSSRVVAGEGRPVRLGLTDRESIFDPCGLAKDMGSWAQE